MYSEFVLRFADVRYKEYIIVSLFCLFYDFRLFGHKNKRSYLFEGPSTVWSHKTNKKKSILRRNGGRFDFEQNHIYFKYNFSTARAIQSVRKYREKWKIILHTILHRYVLGNFRGRSLAVLWSNSGNFSIWQIFCLVFVTLAFYNFVTIII